MCHLGCGSGDPGCGVEPGRADSLTVSPRIQALWVLDTKHTRPTPGLQGHVCHSWAILGLSFTSPAPSERCEG